MIKSCLIRGFLYIANAKDEGWRGQQRYLPWRSGRPSKWLKSGLFMSWGDICRIAYYNCAFACLGNIAEMALIKPVNDILINRRLAIH